MSGLFLEDDVIFVDNGTRGYVNDRNNSTHLLKQLLQEHRVPYISIKGSYLDRLLFAMKEVDKLYNERKFRRPSSCSCGRGLAHTQRKAYAPSGNQHYHFINSL